MPFVIVAASRKCRGFALEFVVHLPPNTPWSHGIFLSGSGSALGRWAADAIPLERTADDVAFGRVEFPSGWHGQYLVTLGDWRNAENDGRGRERTARELIVGPQARVELTVAGWGRDGVRYHPEFRSEFLGNARTVSVHLPPGYDLETERRYSVLYMHDGQNLFDAATAFAGNPWAADDGAERAARNHDARPVILVGIANTEARLEEYGPRRGDESNADERARLYARFLVEEVKPFMDRHYRTSTDAAHTGTAGSSMGGLIALHLAKWHPRIFGRCAALSPSLWWDRESFLRSMTSSDEWLHACRLWLCMGDGEGIGNVRRTRKLASLWKANGRLEHHDYEYREIEGGTHDEWSWRRRFPDVLQFLFPPDGSHAG